ncbi:hypothetical protein M422DRAFT_276280 [Sphaerobolus stellatus SS14]|uniref:Uncharacterized protein n=1 Tax=Sphaerobolus stellatus (strain SS14) TaxID=990650 RepID=A0A0C9UCJ7_SPHS4|nr:hypothetical protein M422DRAFT_276280 [Sphaerobolus stellatus SS14]
MGGVSFITSGSPILLFFYTHFYFHPVYSNSNTEAKAPSFNGLVHHAAPFHAKNGSSCFSFKGICTSNNIEDKLCVGVPILVTFTVSWYEWIRADDMNSPSMPTSPSKKKAKGYTTAMSFNIPDVVQLSDEPTTGDDYFYEPRMTKVVMSLRKMYLHYF